MTAAGMSPRRSGSYTGSVLRAVEANDSTAFLFHMHT